MGRVLTWLGLLSLSACGGDGGKTELWIYTSIYPHVIERLTPALEAEFPDVAFKWLQMGSEQVAGRLGGELAAGRTECDLLMTSDPFYYAQLHEAGHLLPYETSATARVPAGLKDPAHAYATVRIPVMVMAVRDDAEEAPTTFRELAESRWNGRVAQGDPLKSGTNFTTVAMLSRELGWTFYEALRANDLQATGGNSVVIKTLSRGERPVGIVLLENLLRTKEKAPESPFRIVFPEDGAIPVPSPIAILRSTDQAALAKQVYDFMFGETAQAEIVRGHMYSPLPDHPPPEGAPAWADLKLRAWSNELLHAIKRDRDAVKERWRKIMK